jgi:hypothetical protein
MIWKFLDPLRFGWLLNRRSRTSLAQAAAAARGVAAGVDLKIKGWWDC